MLGNLEGGADSGEVLHLSTSGASIETLHVATFTLGEWRGDIDFAEVGGADDVACHLSEFVCGRDEAGYRHDTCIDEEFTYLGYATDVFAAVFFGEAEVGVDAGTDVVAVEQRMPRLCSSRSTPMATVLLPLPLKPVIHIMMPC